MKLYRPLKHSPKNFEQSGTKTQAVFMTDYVDGDTPLSQFEDIIPVVVCVNYDDFLEVSLAANRKMFKDYIVVTSPDDKNTQSLCERHQVDCRVYDSFYENARFNKSGALNWVQRDLHAKHPDKWVLILDSDIILPPTFPRWFDLRLLDKSKLYGFRRKDFLTPEDFISKRGTIVEEEKCVGYFQLYYDKRKFYPQFSESASWCDILFKRMFEVEFVSESLYVYHLGEMFANHNGRVSGKWN
jgi:hypothetical protein